MYVELRSNSIAELVEIPAAPCDSSSTSTAVDIRRTFVPRDDGAQGQEDGRVLRM